MEQETIHNRVQNVCHQQKKCVSAKTHPLHNKSILKKLPKYKLTILILDKMTQFNLWKERTSKKTIAVKERLILNILRFNFYVQYYNIFYVNIKTFSYFNCFTTVLHRFSASYKNFPQMFSCLFTRNFFRELHWNICLSYFPSI